MFNACSVFFALLAAAAVPGGDAYEQGRAAEAKGRFGDAAGHYAACVVAGAPLAPYAQVRGAVCRAIAGDLAGGAKELDTLMESGADAPWAAMAAHERALLYIRDNKRPEAAALFSRAHEAPTDLWWLEDIRWAAAENALSLPGREGPAIAFFDTEARTSIWGKKRYEAANLLATVPKVDVRLITVIYLVAAGASNEAEPLLRSIPEFGPEQLDLRRLRDRAQGRVDIARGRTEAGRELLWKVGTDPAAGETGLDALLDLVNHHARLKQFDEGERAMLRLVALKPGGAQTLSAHKALAAAYVREARPEDAEKHYAEVMGHTTDAREIQAALLSEGNAYRQQGRNQEALDRYAPLLDRYAASESGVEAAYWSGAILYEAGAEKERVFSAFRSAASHGVSNYYGHRAQDLLAQLGDRDAKREKTLKITPKESILRPIRIDHDKPESALKKLAGDERVARMAFFAERGYPEAEWEALAIANTLKDNPDAPLFYQAMSEAGATAFTAMQLAAATRLGDNEDGSQSLARLRLRYPLAYGDLVNRYAKSVGIDPYLMLAIARQESTYRPALTSIAGAQGVMQIMPATAKWLAKENADIPDEIAGELADPRASLLLGAHYLHLMIDRYDGNLVYALAAYNGGPGNCDTWRRNFKGATFAEFIEFIPFSETRTYVKRVLANYVTYHSIYPDAN